MSKTIAGRVPFIELSTLSGRPDGTVWISDCHGAALNRIKGNWDRSGWVLCDDYYWPNREAAQAFIDEHADKPERPAVTPVKRITAGVTDMLAIIESGDSTDDEKAAAASTIVEAVAPDIFEMAYPINDGPSKARPAAPREGLELPTWHDWHGVTEPDWYWWWNGDEDSAPIPVSIGGSLDGKYYDRFVAVGQLGWTPHKPVSEMGGLWCRALPPGNWHKATVAGEGV